MKALLKFRKESFVVLFLLLSISLQGQWNKEFAILNQYQKWGITAGPTFFNKATISSQFGEQSFDNKITTSFNAGIEYAFFADRRWSFLTGLLVSKEPVYNIDHPDFFGKQYTSGVNFSIPLITQMQIQVGEKVFLTLSAGYKATYIAPTTYIYGVGSNPENKEEEIFSLSLNTPDNHIYGSALFNVGTALAMKPFLMKINVTYNIYFQNIVTGTYQFNDVAYTTPSTTGAYKLSGNYLGVMVSFYLKKPRKE